MKQEPKMQSFNVDTLLVGGDFVCMDAGRRVIQNGALAVKDARIVWLGARDEIDPGLSARETLNLAGKVIIPGLVNTHGHWAMTLFRGLVHDRALEAWLQKIWQVEAAVISPETVTAGSELAMIEMIRGGTTCAADMYWHYHESFQAVRKAGFRMVNGPSFAEIPGFESRKFNYQSAADFLERYMGDPLIHLRMQAHSVYTTSQPMLEKIAEMMGERGIGFITHASESQGELELVRKKYGRSPIEVLDSAGLLGEHSLLAHCVHLSDAEIGRLAETRTSVAHCPSSNLLLSSGIARVADMLKAGVNVSIGTDGPASNNDLDLLHEAQLAALLQKGSSGDPTVLPAEQVFAMLTIDGARALGLAQQTGSLEAGKLADLAVIDFDAPNLVPCYDLYSHLIYAASIANVRDVMINGQWVMRERALLTLEEARVKAAVRQVAEMVRAL
jgi:5-methylthioadenosine/S-adenosylhomocysteine deaminase